MVGCKYKEKQMANRNNSIGGVHFEKGRGYRATVTINGRRVRSQRVGTENQAKRLLGKIRRALVTKSGNLDVQTDAMMRLYLEGKVSISG